MLRRAKVARGRRDPGFRWRGGGDVSRLDKRPTLTVIEIIQIEYA